MCIGRERLGKRSLGEGLMRSAIVLYNEEHPHGMELAQLAASDMRKCVPRKPRSRAQWHRSNLARVRARTQR